MSTFKNIALIIKKLKKIERITDELRSLLPPYKNGVIKSKSVKRTKEAVIFFSELLIGLILIEVLPFNSSSLDKPSDASITEPFEIIILDDG